MSPTTTRQQSDEENKPLSWHISRLGLSNEIVSELMSNLINSNQYLGVNPCLTRQDRKNIMKKIKEFEQREGRGRKGRRHRRGKKNVHPFCFIVNIGAHFVCVHVNAGCLLYIDSFANPIPETMVSLFEKMVQQQPQQQQHRKGMQQQQQTHLLFHNKRQIQSFLSSHCGLYAALFATWYLSPPEMRMPLKFSDENLLANDEKCIAYLKQFTTMMHQ